MCLFIAILRALASTKADDNAYALILLWGCYGVRVQLASQTILATLFSALQVTSHPKLSSIYFLLFDDRRIQNGSISRLGWVIAMLGENISCSGIDNSNHACL